MSISIHPLRGEWDNIAYIRKQKGYISIHPLRGEWDTWTAATVRKKEISIHPLRGEWDPSAPVAPSGAENFNPPTPWGVGQQNCTKKYAIFIQSKQCYRFGLRFVRV